MKAFLAALVLLAVVTVGADMILDNAGFGSAQVYSTDNVRLGEAGPGGGDVLEE